MLRSSFKTDVYYRTFAQGFHKHIHTYIPTTITNYYYCIYSSFSKEKNNHNKLVMLKNSNIRTKSNENERKGN